MLSSLLIEDNHFFRQSLKEGLEENFPSMKITEACNGKEAVDQFRECSPDLVFMDIRLPDASGFDIAKKIRSEKSECTIFFLTSYDIPEYRKVAFQNGADFFFSKDCSPVEIYTVVKSLIKRQQ